MELLSTWLESNYFQVKDKFYKQNNELVLGGVASPLLSNIVMIDFKNSLINNFNKKPKICLKYIDDIFCICSHGLLPKY